MLYPRLNRQKGVFGFMKRREAREALFTLLYEMTFNLPDELENVIALERQERDIEDKYLLDSVRGIYSHLDEIDRRIAENSVGWKHERLSRVSLSIMRISVYEMCYTDIPFNISINEAVELAKKYDHDKAPSFINGILNAVASSCGLK